jgi:integrase
MKRRDQDGLHRRPNTPTGTWYFRFKGADGRLHEHSTKTSSFADAREIRNQFLAAIKQFGTPSERATWTFRQAAEFWLKKRALDGLRVNTLQLDRERLVRLNAFFGEMKLAAITPATLIAYKERRKEKVKPRTFNMERRIVRAVLREANLWAAVERDFGALREAKGTVGRALEPDEEEALFLAASTHKRWEPVLYFAVLLGNTGCRKSELLNLRLCDVDLPGRKLTIPKAKTEAGKRTIPLNEAALAAAAWLWKRAAGLGAKHAEHYLLPAYAWRLKEAGDAFDVKRPQRTIRTAWRAVVKFASGQSQPKGVAPEEWMRESVKGLRMHDLRHDFRSDLADADVEEATAMEIMGHDSVEMSKLYRHMRKTARAKRDEDKRKAVEAVGGQKGGARVVGSRGEPVLYARDNVVQMRGKRG